MGRAILARIISCFIFLNNPYRYSQLHHLDAEPQVSDTCDYYSSSACTIIQALHHLPALIAPHSSHTPILLSVAIVLGMTRLAEWSPEWTILRMYSDDRRSRSQWLVDCCKCLLVATHPSISHNKSEFYIRLSMVTTAWSWHTLSGARQVY